MFTFPHRYRNTVKEEDPVFLAVGPMPGPEARSGMAEPVPQHPLEGSLAGFTGLTYILGHAPTILVASQKDCWKNFYMQKKKNSPDTRHHNSYP